MQKIKEERPYKIRVRNRFRRIIKEKRYGVLLKCKKCNITYFTNDTTIKKRKQLDLCQKCVNSGKNHGMWRGGKLKRQGYILLWKPRCKDSDIKGYIKEHRYRLSKKLKRRLLKTEIVHHKNCIRSDNRLKNLHLCKNFAEHAKLHMKINRRCKK